jgi:hypothetical protein
MNKVPYTNSPKESGYYWFWPRDASNDYSERELLKVCVLRGEVREIDIVAGFSFPSEPHKVSKYTGVFQGPYLKLKEITD